MILRGDFSLSDYKARRNRARRRSGGAWSSTSDRPKTRALARALARDKSILVFVRPGIDSVERSLNSAWTTRTAAAGRDFGRARARAADQILERSPAAAAPAPRQPMHTPI
jgi:hypothetical protein